MKIYLRETNGERWSCDAFAYPSTTWGKLEFLFSQFTVCEDRVDGVLNLSAIGQVWMAVFSGPNNSPSNPTFYFDPACTVGKSL